MTELVAKHIVMNEFPAALINLIDDEEILNESKQIEQCDNEEESIELEARYIRNTDNCVNIRIPGRTRKEYYEENKDEILKYLKEYREAHRDELFDYRKEYYEENKDKLNEKHKEYYEAHRDEIKEYYKEYYQENKDKLNEKNKEYYEAHRDEIKEYHKEYMKGYNKEYYEENKDKIKEKKKEKYTCECGSTLTVGGKATHEKTKKHLNFINSK
jgi:hypothetical protein